MIRLAATVTTTLWLAAAAAAQPVTYICDVRPSDDGWIPARITATFDTATQRAAVQDAFTDEFNAGRPAEARFKQRRNGRLRASWSLGNVRASRGGARRVSWSLEVDPATNAAIARAHWDMVGEGARQPPTSRGTCQVASSPNLLG